MIAWPVAVIPLACGHHPSFHSWHRTHAPGLNCSVASALSARITPRNLATSADNVLLVGTLHLRILRARAVQRCKVVALELLEQNSICAA